MRRVLVVGLVVLCGFAGGCGVRVLEPEVRLQRTVAFLQAAPKFGVFSDDGRFVAALGTDGHVAVWDAETGDLLAQRLGVSPRSVTYDRTGPLDFGDDNRLAIANLEGGVTIWSWLKSTDEVVPFGFPGPPDVIAFCEEGSVSASFGGYRFKVDETTGKNIFEGFDAFVLCHRDRHGILHEPIEDPAAMEVAFTAGSAVVRRSFVAGQTYGDAVESSYREQTPISMDVEPTSSLALIDLTTAKIHWTSPLSAWQIGLIVSSRSRIALVPDASNDESLVRQVLLYDGRTIRTVDAAFLLAASLQGLYRYVLVQQAPGAGSFFTSHDTLERVRDGERTRFGLADGGSVLWISPFGDRLLTRRLDLYKLP
ncbi:MAG: hypothetical protein AAGI46_07905 [Planctomycetota bacterium]